MCAGMGSFALPGASSFLSSLKESYQRKPLETTFQDFLARECAGVAPAGASLRRPHFFLRRKKCGKESRLDLRSKGPLARCGSCRFGGVYSRAGCSGHHCRSKGLCLRSPARRLPRPLASATVGVFASTGWAIIKSRLCRLAAAKVGVPVGHGYNYFLACDTAERIIFTVVTGSGSGKLCRHSPFD